MAKENIEDKVRNLLENIINSLGYELYDVEYSKEGKDYYLRIFIDSSNGINLDDCEKVSDAINLPLDEADFIDNQYFLEVSSTGLEKNLRRDSHFENSIGKKVELKLFEKVNDKKVLEGILEDFKDNQIYLNVDDNVIIINKKNISAAKIVYDWNKED